MESKISVAKELDYQTKINSSPLYRYQIVTQSQGGGNTVSLNQNSTQLTYFDLPPEVVWNASKSFFTWQITYPTAAARVAPYPPVLKLLNSSVLLVKFEHIFQ